MSKSYSTGVRGTYFVIHIQVTSKLIHVISAFLITYLINIIIIIIIIIIIVIVIVIIIIIIIIIITID